MFEKLQKKWKVGALQLLLILLTFAIGGSLTGYVGKKIMNYLHVQDWLWVFIYIILVTIIWPFAVLLISIPFGQLPFFLKYIGKLGRRIGIGKPKQIPGEPVNIAIFASGAGSNAENIIQNPLPRSYNVALIVCNKPGAGVLKIAERNKIPTLMIEKGKFNKDGYLGNLIKHQIEFIVLAGFLWKLPPALIDNFPK